MLDEVKKSLKAKLYDLTYSPFMSSYIITWAIIHHKYILICLSKNEIDKKLEILSKYDFGMYDYKMWALPLVASLFYVYIYPLISKHFYSYTLDRKKELKEIKSKIEDETPLTKEESKEYRTNFHVMSKQLDETMKELVEQKSKYEEELKIQVEAEKKFLLEKSIKHENEIKEITNKRLKKFIRYRNRYVTIINQLKSRSNEPSVIAVPTPSVIPISGNLAVPTGIITAATTSVIPKIKNLNNISSNNDNINSFLEDEQFDVKILKKHEVAKIMNNSKIVSLISEKIKNKELFVLQNGNYIIIKKSGFTYEELIVLNYLYTINSTELISLGTFKNGIRTNYKTLSVFKIDMILSELGKKNIFYLSKDFIKVTENTIKIFIELFEEE